MTTKPAPSPQHHRGKAPLPDPPRLDMQQTRHFFKPGAMTILSHHLDALRPDATTLVDGNGYLCQHRSDFPRCPYPDLMVAFNIDPHIVALANGYIIDEVGKPPDFVLEVASASTARNDYITKRTTYANLGVPEYWRFDYTGGQRYNAPLAGDRLSESGAYHPILLTTEPDGTIWGHSQALGLSLCWISGRLRYWDPTQAAYLPDLSEAQTRINTETQARINAEYRAARELARANTEASRANAEAQARAEAEARARTLEQELRRRENP